MIVCIGLPKTENAANRDGELVTEFGCAKLGVLVHGEPEAAYAALWDAINGPGAWDANPFVVALTFSVEHRNIDANKEPTP